MSPSKKATFYINQLSPYGLTLTRVRRRVKARDCAPFCVSAPLFFSVSFAGLFHFFARLIFIFAPTFFFDTVICLKIVRANFAARKKIPRASDIVGINL